MMISIHMIILHSAQSFRSVRTREITTLQNNSIETIKNNKITQRKNIESKTKIKKNNLIANQIETRLLKSKTITIRS